MRFWMAVLVVVAFGALAFAFVDMVAEARDDAEYARLCEELGGRALNINHDPLCVSSDGRVMQP